jgi:copper chaperone NosL
MTERARRGRSALVALLALAGVLAAAGCAPPDEPQPIAWDREPCAHCRMLIGDPAFAAQLVRADGRVESFDDPGCLLARLDEQQPRVHALWFHHLREDRWLPGDGVAFVRVSPTPMNYGFGAVDPGTPGALALDEVRAELRARWSAAP